MRDLFPRPLFNLDGGGGAAAGGDAGGAGGGAATAAGAAGAGAGAAGVSQAAAWYDGAEGLTAGLSQEHRTFLAGKGFPDLQTFVSSAMNSDKLARDRNVMMRPDPAKLAEWSGWQDLGWKEKLEDYQLKRPQKSPEQYDETFTNRVRELAHEARVPLSAAQRMLDGMGEFFASRIEELDLNGARANRELDAALRKEWGPDYERNNELAQRAARHLGIGLDDGAELERIVGSPRLVQMMHKIGTMLGEDRLVSSAGAGMGGMSLSQVEAELARQANDPKFMEAFRDTRNPQHADVHAQRSQLLARKAKFAAG